MTKYKEGSIVRGYVTGIEKYGAFVSLPDYYNGLVHISEISDGYIRDINEYFKIGDLIYVKILEIDEKMNQMRLSIRGIDYRVDGSEIQRVKEVGTGFQILKEQLPKWICEKMNEIQKKSEIKLDNKQDKC